MSVSRWLWSSLRVDIGPPAFDIDPRKVSAIEAGSSYIPDVPSARVAALREGGSLRATTDFAVVRALETVNICVPTPLRKTKDPDMSFVISAVEQVAGVGTRRC